MPEKQKTGRKPVFIPVTFYPSPLTLLLKVPRSPSLELYVLPNGGGQNFFSYYAQARIWFQMELRGLEPLTSAMRMQLSPS